MSALSTLAAACLLAACGGGDASPPAGATDTTPPTVAITDNVAAASASGDVTFTFTFSEGVGSTFSANDISVAGGTKGTFTVVSPTSATLVVTPTANTAGTITVDVAAGAFADAAGNAGTVAATASQAYNTASAVVSGSTGTCTAAPCNDFGNAAIVYAGFGGASGSQADDPALSTNKVFKFVKAAGAEIWGGVTVFSNGQNVAIPTADLSAGKTVTLRVYSPAAGKTIKLKFETLGDPTRSVETDVVTTLANAWETLTFNFSNPSAGTAAFNAAYTYNMVSVFADYGVVPGADETFYIDELTYTAASGGAGGGVGGGVGGGGATVLTFSSGFAAGGRTVQGGAFGGYSGSNLDNFNCDGQPQNCGSGGSFTDTVAAAASGFYYYYQTSTPATALYAGIFVQAPGLTTGLSPTADTAGLQLGNQTTMSFKFGQNPEWFNSGATNKFLVMLTLGKFYTVGSGPCNIKLAKVVTPTASASTSYTLNLSEFAVTQNCAVPNLTVAGALALSPVSQIDFQGDGGGSAITVNGVASGANLSVSTGTPAVYPTTLVVDGGITFQ
ncbi:Ig-like domain-containing protein [Leptothrix discophora]|uniref:Ig-like domain-containing protein n=1 Tax=Leptothrix discophora TaxID=89 RepID=A0ABT9G2Z7_LEPDI|nr:Ig-like domain-containing protein [Leptothrix discophora]